MIDKNKLPKDWKWVRLGDLTQKINKVKRKEVLKEEELIYLDIGGIDNSSNKIITYKKYLWKDAPSRAQQIVEVGDVLFSTVRTYMKNIAIVDKQIYQHQIASSGFTILRANKETLYKYIFYLSISDVFLNPLNELQTGSSYPAVRDSDVLNQKTPLPPLEIQNLIVSKIEELFSELDKGIEDLKTSQQQLKTYRQSVLKYAFEGRLTNKKVKDGELPKGWNIFKIGEVCKTIDGDRGPNYPKKEEFSKEGYCLYLSTKNVREDRFLFEETIFITKEKDEKLRSGKLQKNDVVITTRGTLGNVALYDNKVPFEHVRINSGMLILRIENENLYNYYLMKFITSPVFVNQLKNMQTGTAQPQIPANILREIEIPIPANLEEQHQIVQEIESRLSVADKMEESIAQSLLQAEALRQSILKKAFSGELV